MSVVLSPQCAYALRSFFVGLLNWATIVARCESETTK